MNRKTSVTVSATECADSDSIAEEWLIMPPISLATAIARLTSPATITVPVDSPPESSPAASCDRTYSVSGAGSVMGRRMPRRSGAQPADGVVRSGARRVPRPSDGGAQLGSGTPPGRGAVRRTAISPHADEVDDEDQGGAGLDDAA